MALHVYLSHFSRVFARLSLSPTHLPFFVAFAAYFFGIFRLFRHVTQMWHKILGWNIPHAPQCSAHFHSLSHFQSLSHSDFPFSPHNMALLSPELCLYCSCSCCCSCCMLPCCVIAAICGEAPLCGGRPWHMLSQQLLNCYWLAWPG